MFSYSSTPLRHFTTWLYFRRLSGPRKVLSQTSSWSKVSLAQEPPLRKNTQRCATTTLPSGFCTPESLVENKGFRRTGLERSRKYRDPLVQQEGWNDVPSDFKSSLWLKDEGLLIKETECPGSRVTLAKNWKCKDSTEGPCLRYLKGREGRGRSSFIRRKYLKVTWERSR